MCAVLARFFFFNDTATTEIYTLSLHDALPIPQGLVVRLAVLQPEGLRVVGPAHVGRIRRAWAVSRMSGSAAPKCRRRERAEPPRERECADRDDPPFGASAGARERRDGGRHEHDREAGEEKAE